VVAFPVDKVVASKMLPSGRKLRRTWVIDFFRMQILNVDGNGKVSKSFDAKALAMMERQIDAPDRLRLLFGGVGHDHTLQFLSANARERFVELAQLMRPSVCCFCPELTAPPPARRNHTRIDITDAPDLEIDVAGGKISSGKTESGGRMPVLDVSRSLHEPCTLWIGTHNLEGNPPPADSTKLDGWLPRGAADVYVVCVQNTPGLPDECFSIYESHLGSGVLLVSSIAHERFGMAVFARRTAFAKISNCEGSKAKIDEESHGAVALAFHLLDTPVHVIGVFLPLAISSQMRAAILQQCISRLQLGLPDSDVTTSAANVFVTGELAFSLSCDQSELSRSVTQQDFSTLTQFDGFLVAKRTFAEYPLSAFDEHPIRFAPTAFTERGPGYVSRILHYTPATACHAGSTSLGASPTVLSGGTRCVVYEPAEELIVSRCLPVAAMYTLMARRPGVACLQHEHQPTYRLVFTQVTISLNPPHAQPDVGGESLSAGDASQKLRSPALRLYSAIGGSIPFIKNPAKSAEGLVFTDSGKHAVELTTNMLPIIDCESVALSVLDEANASGSRHVATATLALRGRVASGGPNRPSNFSLPLIRYGAMVGRCSGRVHWERSSVQLMEGVL
jgi:hypothetical protein